MQQFSSLDIASIPCMFSYCGAQIFEVYGLGAEVVSTAFRGSVSRIGGLSVDEVPNGFSLGCDESSII
jgi:glutamate synthase domain-containing protein 2